MNELKILRIVKVNKRNKKKELVCIFPEKKKEILHSLLDKLNKDTIEPIKYCYDVLSFNKKHDIGVILNLILTHNITEED